MKKMLKRIGSMTLVLALIFAMFPVTATAATGSSAKAMGQLWDSYTEAQSGVFTVTSTSRLFVVSNTAPSGDLLQTAQLIQRELKTKFSGSFQELVWGEESWAKTGDVVLVLDPSSGIGSDGYQLNVNTTTAVVKAQDTDGLIYGVNNLIKCFLAVGGNSICCFEGQDTPDTKQRIVMLDTGRKYYTVEWICNFIRQISWMGYNALEVHFSEDGGFRADLWDEAYYTDGYRPENDFSWLCGSYVQSWVKYPYDTDPDAGKYLTTGELVQICNVAKEYHIEIIPSFDSPAHMDYITWKFEQNYKSNKNYSFTYNGTTYKASSTNGCINYTNYTGGSKPLWPQYTAIDITSGTMARAFVFALYEDIADFFRVYAGSTNFNIGADEVNLSSSTSSYPRTWNYSKFPEYINSLNRMLNAKGYTVRMFNDFIGSTAYNMSSSSKAIYDFDDNIEICYWNSDFNPTTGVYDETIWHVAFFWHDGSTSENVSSGWPSSGWGDGGRTMYNCIQTNCYYVLREGTSGTHRDARDPNNRNWTFYHTNEESIYNEWYPADISERGDYSENAADVPDQYLGGAYFLIWNDYAALNKQDDVWKGALDCYDKDQKYYLFDIMASNIMKMWNSDINSTVDYNSFAAVREKTLEWFPGYTSCSEEASLASASEPTQAYAADHTALTQALANKIQNNDGFYTVESYQAYETAYANAQKVNEDHGATEAQIQQAINQLNQAANALEEFHQVDKTQLESAVRDAVADRGDYTQESWNVYAAALEQAKTVLQDENAIQEQVDQALADLKQAYSDLKVEMPEESVVYRITKSASSTPLKKKVGLTIHTAPEVEELTVQLGGEQVTLTRCLHSVQTIDGVEKGVWLVNFSPSQRGVITYTIYCDGKPAATIDITVR